MSVGQPVGSDHQLGRLLQIGVVLEEVVEARSRKHLASAEDLDADLEAVLNDGIERASRHRDRMEALIGKLDADSVAYDDIEPLVEAQYQAEQDFDDIVYDQLCNAETAYKFIDDLLAALADSDATFGVDRAKLRDVLMDIREAEAEGVEAVTELMEERA